MIDFNLAAKPRESDASLDLNLNCFVKPGGCRDIVEMSPKIWKITSPTVIYSRMPSGADANGDIGPDYGTLSRLQTESRASSERFFDLGMEAQQQPKHQEYVQAEVPAKV